MIVLELEAAVLKRAHSHPEGAMKIILANRYFYPDESATSRMTTSLARALAEDGHAVHVLTGRKLHNNPASSLPPEEEVDGVKVHRLWTTRFGRDRLAGRMCDYATFHASAFFAFLRLARRGDVVVICTDPPMLSVTAMVPTRLTGAHMVNWVLDLFPEVAMDLGVLGRGSLPARLSLWLRDLSLKAAAANVAPMERMAAYLEQRGVPAGRLAVIHHWSDGAAIKPIDAHDCVLRREWGLANKFVVGYSGNLGRAHEFDTILDAAASLAHRDDIAFLFVGGGYRRPWVEEEVKRRGLSNVIFKPLQPRERLAECLGVPDVHLVTLLPEMEPYIVPSKFYGIAAAGRPTLFVGDPDGEIARVVNDAHCGAAFAIGEAEALASVIRNLAMSVPLRRNWGINARRVFDERFNEAGGVAEWRRLIRGLAPAGDRGDAPVVSRSLSA
jgi:glycosyltransferase involved in cell wall biosynthesis